jgi:hypothetical protein
MFGVNLTPTLILNSIIELDMHITLTVLVRASGSRSFAHWGQGRLPSVGKFFQL